MTPHVSNGLLPISALSTTSSLIVEQPIAPIAIFFTEIEIKFCQDRKHITDISVILVLYKIL